MKIKLRSNSNTAEITTIALIIDIDQVITLAEKEVLVIESWLRDKKHLEKMLDSMFKAQTALKILRTWQSLPEKKYKDESISRAVQLRITRISEVIDALQEHGKTNRATVDPDIQKAMLTCLTEEIIRSLPNASK